MSKNDYRFMSRAELTAYLEGRGFAVYDDETLTELRESARLDMIMADVTAKAAKNDPLMKLLDEEGS